MSTNRLNSTFQNFHIFRNSNISTIYSKIATFVFLRNSKITNGREGAIIGIGFLQNTTLLLIEAH